MRTILAITGVLALLSMATPSLADDWTAVLERADADADGAIDRMEVMNFSDPLGAPGFKPFLAVHFETLDRNADGKVTRDEMAAAMHDMDLTDEELTALFEKRIYENL